MDANEKKQARAYIGKHIDVSKARLTDNEAVELREFIDRYDDYRGTTRADRYRRRRLSGRALRMAGDSSPSLKPSSRRH